MNITSYNLTDVSYHYVGLRVVKASSGESRDRLAERIGTAVQKLVMDRALRLMLPAPRGTFSSVGEKVLNELKHFGLTESAEKSIRLSEAGYAAWKLLENRQFVELRRLFARLHVETYTNLWAVVEYLASGQVLLRPIKDGLDPSRLSIAWKTFLPWEADSALLSEKITVKTAEDAITNRLLKRHFPKAKLTVPIFRSMCDRLASLRLINQSRIIENEMDAFIVYGTCSNLKTADWHRELHFAAGGEMRALFLSEFALNSIGARAALLHALDVAFKSLKPEGGFFDLPDVRDRVCFALRIPEASFDEALVELLEESDSPVSMGLRYDRITGRRKPLTRQPGNQIFNLVRPTYEHRSPSLDQRATS